MCNRLAGDNILNFSYEVNIQQCYKGLSRALKGKPWVGDAKKYEN